MVQSKHTIFQNVLRGTYYRVLQRHIVSILRTIKFANIPMVRVEILNSFLSETESFNSETVRLVVNYLDSSKREQRALPRIAELFSTIKPDKIPSFMGRVS